MPREVRIAHVTDPHLNFGLPRGRELLGKRGLSALSWWMRRHRLHLRSAARTLEQDVAAQACDVIAMTGDLINFGLPREFEGSRQWLERLGSPARVIALPGNHEALARGWREAMEMHWGEYNKTGQMLEFGPVALICVSSALATPPFFATGRVSENDLQALSDQLADARARDLVPVVLIHHPPTPITIARKALSNLARVAECISQGGAALVLHGHTHRRDFSWIDAPHGRVPVIGTPSFSMSHRGNHPPATWREIRIIQNGGGARAEMQERVANGAGGVVARTPLDLALPFVAVGG